METNLNAVSERLREWERMWNSYDLSKVDDLFLLDERLSYFSSEKQGLIGGIEAVRAHHVGFGFVPGGKASANQLWLDDVVARELGDVVVVAAIWCFRRATGAQQRGPVTFVFAPSQDGAPDFRIAHVNFATYR